MGRVISTQEFGRGGKKGVKLTIRQRGTSAGSVKPLVLAQAAVKFPAKASKMEVLGVRKVNNIAGPFNTYEVDVFVPISDIQKPPAQSGDVNANKMT